MEKFVLPPPDLIIIKYLVCTLLEHQESNLNLQNQNLT